MAEPLVIETAGLCKRYGGREGGTDALRGLDLEVPAGSICGFLGRDGAGKTTTIKVLLGMAHASGGRARVFGLPVGDEPGPGDQRGDRRGRRADPRRDLRARRGLDRRRLGTWSQRSVSLPLTFARDAK